MSNMLRIEKEQGDIVVVPELEALARRFKSQTTVTEFKRPAMVMVIEWAALASVALFMAKPLFEEMAKEIGKESGKAIVAAFKKQFFEAKAKSPRLYSGEEMDELLESRRRSELEYDRLRHQRGRQYAPLEIDIDFPLPDGSVQTFRFVFPSSLEDRHIDVALVRLSSEWQEIIQGKFEKSEVSFKVAGMPSEPIDQDFVYIPAQDRWMGRKEIIKFLQQGGKI